MEEVLIDGTTLASATRLLSGQDRPSALSISALSLLAESLILHETIVALDTSKDDGALRGFAAQYQGCIVVRHEDARSILESYAERENSSFAYMKKKAVDRRRPDGTLSFSDQAGNRNASIQGARILDNVIMRNYLTDLEMMSYLDDVEEAFGDRSHSKVFRDQKSSIRNLGNLRKMPPDGDSSQRHLPVYPWRDALAADDHMASAGDFLIDEYSDLAGSSPWRRTVNEHRLKRKEFRQSLLIRAHFYLLASDYLGIPYRPDALRAPICWKYFDQGSFAKFEIDERFVDKAEEVASEAIVLSNRFLGRDVFAFVPIFLGRVLAESNSVNEILPRILEIRDSAAAKRFRRHMIKLAGHEAAGDMIALIKESNKYAKLLRESYGMDADPAYTSGLSILASGANLALSPSLTNATGLSVGAVQQLTPWWHKRKFALISRSIRNGGRMQLPGEQIERIFKVCVDEDELRLLQEVLRGPSNRGSSETGQ